MKIKKFILSSWKVFIVTAIVFTLIGIYVCAKEAKAGGLNELEFGVSIADDSTTLEEFRNSDSLKNATLYSFGELGFNRVVTGWDLQASFEDGKRPDSVDGKIELYARVFKLKNSLEMLAGVDQPISINNDESLFGDERVYKLRFRQPY